jgi:hypothetical protein
LPAGVSVNTLTGQISGTPAVVGTYPVTISATNGGGTATATLTITVNPPTPVINTPLTKPATVTQPATGALVGAFTDLRVFPNPWRPNFPGNPPVRFDHLPPNSTVKIFTVSGQWVQTLPTSSDTVPWDLRNGSGDRVASGLYLYVITADGGLKTTGILAVIK